MTYSITPSRVALAFGAATLALTVAGCATQLLSFVGGYDHQFGLRSLLDVGSDVSLPTWYSSFALLAAAALLSLIAHSKAHQGAEFVRHWRVLAAIFFLMSIDETAGIHERVGVLATQWLDLRGAFWYGFVLPGSVLVALVGVSYLRFFFHLPRDTRTLFTVAAVIFVGGALGVEMYNSHLHYSGSRASLLYSMMTIVEEFLEMAGIVVFLYALLDYMQTHVAHVHIHVGHGVAFAEPTTLSSRPPAQSVHKARRPGV